MNHAYDLMKVLLAVVQNWPQATREIQLKAVISTTVVVARACGLDENSLLANISAGWQNAGGPPSAPPAAETAPA